MKEEPTLGDEVLQAIGALPPETRAAAFVRHSIREEMTTLRDDVPLTEEGALAARRFGRELDWSLPVLTSSSPRSRCVQTASEILGGFAEVHTGVEASSAGSHTSVAAMLYSFGATPALQELLTGIQRISLTDSIRSPTLTDSQAVFSDKLARQVMSRVINDLRSDTAARLRIFVDHDLHLIMLREHLFGSRYRKIEWIDFLGGFVVYILGDSVMATLHGKTIPYPAHGVHVGSHPSKI